MRQGRVEARVNKPDGAVSPMTIMAWTAAGLVAVLPSATILSPLTLNGNLSKNMPRLPLRMNPPLLPISQRLLTDSAFQPSMPFAPNQPVHVSYSPPTPAGNLQPDKADVLIGQVRAEQALASVSNQLVTHPNSGSRLSGPLLTPDIPEKVESELSIAPASDLGETRGSDGPVGITSTSDSTMAAPTDLAAEETASRFAEGFSSTEIQADDLGQPDQSLSAIPVQPESQRQYLAMLDLDDPQSGGVRVEPPPTPLSDANAPRGASAPVAFIEDKEKSVSVGLDHHSHDDGPSGMTNPELLPTASGSNHRTGRGPTMAQSTRIPETAPSHSAVSEFRMTSRGVEFSTIARTRSDVSGPVRLLIAEDDNILVRLSDVLELVRPLMPPLQFERLSATAAAAQFVSLNELRGVGIPVRFQDNDELAMGAF